MDIEANERTSHYLHSTLRGRIVEDVFVGDALRRLWQHRVTDVEVLRSAFDAGGYDLVMSHRKIARQIQIQKLNGGIGGRLREADFVPVFDKPLSNI